MVLRDWIDYVTIGLALYGTAMSTFNFFRKSLVDWREKNRLRMDCVVGSWSPPIGGGPPKPAIHFRFANTGTDPLTVEAIGYRLAGERSEHTFSENTYTKLSGSEKRSTSIVIDYSLPEWERLAGLWARTVHGQMVRLRRRRVREIVKDIRNWPPPKS